MAKGTWMLFVRLSSGAIKMKKYIDNTFVEQSYCYFNRNYGSKNVRNIAQSIFLEHAIREAKLSVNSLKVLEIGCAVGANLYWLYKEHRCKCTGVEPNARVVRILSKEYPFIRFYVATADALPFSKDEFDLVILRSTLHWVDRNFILQSLGEAIRVTRQWLIVSDFCPPQPFRVPYHYKKGLFTWHMDYTPALLNAGIMKLIYQQCADTVKINGVPTVVFLKDDEAKRKKNVWNLVKTSIFCKKVALLPIKTESDFKRT